jgi:hypothetical protein
MPQESLHTLRISGQRDKWSVPLLGGGGDTSVSKRVCFEIETIWPATVVKPGAPSSVVG